MELDALMETVWRRYGYDFRQYARPSLKRRVANIIRGEGLKTISELQDAVLHDAVSMEKLLCGVTVNVTSMFRDPTFFLTFRRKVIPYLATYPFICIWIAGCSTGEEFYSIAIILEEEGLYDRCRIYATDLNEAALHKAKEGIFDTTKMKEYTANYQKAGGERCFSDYYTAAYNSAVFNPSLTKNIVFARHNLVTDASFNEFQVILCRNVIIYFNNTLRDRVHNLLYDSLVRFGFLGLGSNETIKFTQHEKDYEEIEKGEQLYRKIR